MTFADVLLVIPIISLVIAGWALYRNYALDRQSGVAALIARVDALESKVDIFGIRLTPLFSVMDQRLAGMFHQPSPEHVHMDQLIERYQADRDRLRRSLSDWELEEMTQAIYYGWFLPTQKGQPGENLEANLAANLFLAQLDGLRGERRYLREQAKHGREKGLREARPPRTWVMRLCDWASHLWHAWWQ